jgi:riboflavin kinase/FMN adenylyltransferase
MRIFYGLEGLESIKKPIITIGTFDGVHIGHQKILDAIVKKAHVLGGESVLLTFSPHPRLVLFPESHQLKLIQTETEKIEKLSKTGLENLIVFPFTFEFSRLTAMEFVRDILVNKLNIHTIVIGYDHQFGRNREGNIQYLKDVSSVYDFEAVEIPVKEIDEVNVSSTKIRKAIENGDVERANLFLGAPFELNGTVIKGAQIGRTIGFPTANLSIEDPIKILPENGVYLVNVILNNVLVNGIMNIGVRPTISPELKKQIEIHIFDFERDIYGQKLQVEILTRLRDEIKFDNKEALVQQIQQDISLAHRYFSITSME